MWHRCVTNNLVQCSFFIRKYLNFASFKSNFLRCNLHTLKIILFSFIVLHWQTQIVLKLLPKSIHRTAPSSSSSLVPLCSKPLSLPRPWQPLTYLLFHGSPSLRLSYKRNCTICSHVSLASLPWHKTCEIHICSCMCHGLFCFIAN